LRKVDAVNDVDLILHQGYEWRNDQRGAAEKARGDLVGQGFARAGGHDPDAIAARQHRGNDVFLARPKSLIAEDVLQYRGRLVEVCAAPAALAQEGRDLAQGRHCGGREGLRPGGPQLA
jgi:hypothetical protein